MQIIVATRNNGKVEEIKRLLSDLPFRLRSLNDFNDIVEVEETGATFTENAVLKARSYALQTGAWSLADDSGLEVEALGGTPGIFSARYGGANSSDAAKMEKLLQEMGTVKDKNRRARFVCAMAISDSNGEIKFTTEEICNGSISSSQKGVNGFGYDPIFIPDGFDQTFGELSDEIKQKISHRARAAKKIIQYLRAFKAVSLDL